MKISDLSPETAARIKTYRWDRIIEKHEGPETWSGVFEYGDPEFLSITGHDVLLPVDREHHANITVLRCIEGDDGQALTIFLKDTTHGDQWFEAGYLAICDKFPNEAFYLAMVYHEWFIFENPSP